MAPSAAGLAVGSSPRMRGTRQPVASTAQQTGIIPAYAGNTAIDKAAADFWRDHPRVCGEHIIRDAQFVLFPGSSPRMRGTQFAAFEPLADEGIIPAYAGNTCIRLSASNSRQDHPRVCGEHATCAPADVVRSGSSPRMRGTRAVRLSCCSCDGIIPAYAGNTIECMANEGLQPGSSPRMRGTPHE